MTQAEPTQFTTQSRVSRILGATTTIICVTVIAHKFLLADRLNVNWDEFYYLSFVHSPLRGEFNLLLKGAFVHLFGWLGSVGNEVDQVVAARLVMVALLGVTAALVWRLGRRWLSGFAASVPPLVFLTAVPVMVHGGSFRADSLVAPLLMAALVAFTAPALRDAQRAALGGALLGAATAISVKVALFAPLAAAMLLLNAQAGGREEPLFRQGAIRAAVLAILSAIVVLATILVLHKASLSPTGGEALADFGARVARKTLLDVPWFPRLDVLQIYLAWQPLPWVLIAIGWLAAIMHRRWDLAAVGLTLLPVAVYRNAFPYFYMEMLAPLSILAGFAVQEAIALTTRKSKLAYGDIVAVVLWAGLLHQGLLHAGRLAQDQQSQQRELVEAVHMIFPQPVNYVDRCGMIGSHRKVNPFLSTWGVETYRTRGVPFMPEATAHHKAAFVLVNSAVLNPAYDISNGLLPEDRDMIRRLYPTYWGPIRVAGGSAVLSDLQAAHVEVPFPGRYRLFAKAPLELDGVVVMPGSVIDVPDRSVTVKIPGSTLPSESVEMTLFLAAAGPPPAHQLPAGPIFLGL